MNKAEYISDRFLSIIIFITTILLTDFFLLVMKNQITTVILVTAVLFIGFSIALCIDYSQKNKFYKDCYEKLKSLDKPYLLGEIISKPQSYDQKHIKELLQKSNKSVIEEINKVNDSKKDYKEFIESFVHEVKIPVTAIKLICENNKSSGMDGIETELLDIEMQIENILYYARSENVYKDYIIHNISLITVIEDILAEEKRLFISNRMAVDLSDDLSQYTVYTDEKWLGFLLKQLFVNSIKYKTEKCPLITIKASKNANNIVLSVKDNGIGILPEDIPRIFEKGFTGKNGRKEKASTGIGLFLCKSLCDKLGIGIECKSVVSEYTEFSLIFPDSKHNEM